MAFSENFSAGLGHWTISRWRSYMADEPGDPGHTLSASDVSGTLDGRTNVFPPSDVFIGSANALFVGAGSQNYGDSVLRCDTKIDLSGTRTITLQVFVPANNKLQGWPYLYVTDAPLTAPSMTSENSAGPTPRYGFVVRFNASQNFNGSAFMPAPEVLTYDNYVESAIITDPSHAPTISAVAMTTAVLTITHSHLTITAGGATWFDANWTLNSALVDGWVYLGSHNHASRKYSPFNDSYNSIFGPISWDGANYPAQTTYKAPDAAVVHTPPSEPQGYDVGYNTPVTLTIPGVPSGVSAARLLLSAKCDALTNPRNGFQVVYSLNGNANVTVPFPSYTDSGSLLLSTPVDVTKLVAGSNTVAINITGNPGGWAANVGNVQLLVESLGGFKVGTTPLKVMRLGTTKVLKAFIGTALVWADTPDPTAPLAPVLNTATPSATQVALAWTAPSSDGGSAITDYTVEYRISPAGSWNTFAHTASTATSRTVTGLTNGTAYDFRVSAVNAVGTGATSNVLTATPASIAAFASASAVASQTTTVAKPAGVAVGDLLLIFFQSDTGTDSPTLSGWTKVQGTYTSGSSRRLGFFWKIATSTEVSASSFTLTGSFTTGVYTELVCCRYTGAHATTPINVSGIGTATQATATAAAITTTQTNCLDVCLMCFDGGSFNSAPPAGTTREVNGASAYNFYAADRVQATAGSTGTLSFASNGDTGNPQGYCRVGVFHS